MFKLNSLPVFLNLTTERRKLSALLHNFAEFFILHRTVPSTTVALSILCFLFALDVSPSPRPSFNCSLRMCCSSLFSSEPCYLMCSMCYRRYCIKWRSKKAKLFLSSNFIFSARTPKTTNDVNETL